MVRIKFQSIFIPSLIFVFIFLFRSIFSKYVPFSLILPDESYFYGAAQGIYLGKFSDVSMQSTHMPLYSALLSFAFYASTHEKVYYVMKIINIIVTSSIVFMAWYILNVLFKINKLKSVVYTLIISISPSILCYSYLLMSENLSITMFFLFFLSFLVLIRNPTLFRHIWLGLVLGLMLVTRYEYKALLVVFAVLTLLKLLLKHKNAINYLVSLSFAVIVFLFCCNMFSGETNGATVLLNDYIDAVPDIFTNKNYLVLTLFSEISYVLLLSGILPITVISYWILTKIRILKTPGELLKSDKAIFIIIFSFYAIFTICLTTWHIFFAWRDLQAMTYGRYLENLVPVIICAGIVLFETRASKKFFLSIGVVLITCFIALFLQRILQNNAITLIGIIDSYYFYIWVSVLGLSAFLAIFLSRKNNLKTWIIFPVIMFVFSLFLTITAHKNHIFIGASFYKDYLAVSRQVSNLKESTILLEWIPNIPAFEGELLENFSAVFNSDITSTVQLSRNIEYENEQTLEKKNLYIFSDRMMLGLIMGRDRAGRYFYDIENQENYKILDTIQIKEFTKETTTELETNGDKYWVWSIEPEIQLRTFIRNVDSINIDIDTIPFVPEAFQSQIYLYINGISCGRSYSVDNKFSFSVNMESKNIFSIEFRSSMWNPLTYEFYPPEEIPDNHSELLGLAFNQISFSIN